MNDGRGIVGVVNALAVKIVLDSCYEVSDLRTLIFRLSKEESQIALPNEFLDRPVVGRDAFGPTLNRRDGVPASALADGGPQPDRFKWADW